jgi:hypothetical protein
MKNPLDIPSASSVDSGAGKPIVEEPEPVKADESKIRCAMCKGEVSPEAMQGAICFDCLAFLDKEDEEAPSWADSYMEPIGGDDTFDD